MLIGKKKSHPFLHEGLILLIENYCKSKAIKLSPVNEKRKGTGIVTYPKRIKGEEEESVNNKASK